MIIATKSDKVKRQEKIKRTAALKRLYRERLTEDTELKIIPFSSLDKSGRDEIYEELDRILEMPQSGS